MERDDRLAAAWRHQVPPGALLQRLALQVARQRRWRWLQRAGEIALTLVAVLLLGGAALTQSMSPSHWLLLPFFLVFVPLAWAITLHGARGRGAHAGESASRYARLRLAQLRSGLRDLWLARWTAVALLAYALSALVPAWLFGDERWRAASMMLLAFALLWGAGTWWLLERRRRRWLREYRALRRLLD